MGELTADELRELRKAVQSAADGLTTFRRVNLDKLSEDESRQVLEAAKELRKQSRKLGVKSIQATAEELSESVQGIEQATKIAANALKKLSNVKKGIAIAASLVGLGTAIATGNPKAIIGAAKDALQTAQG